MLSDAGRCIHTAMLVMLGVERLRPSHARALPGLAPAPQKDVGRRAWPWTSPRNARSWRSLVELAGGFRKRRGRRNVDKCLVAPGGEGPTVHGATSSEYSVPK